MPPESEVPRADPQLDTSVLIRAGQGVPEFVAYLAANAAAGLTYYDTARSEYLVSASTTDLQALEQTHGLQHRQDVAAADVDAAAARLRSAFDGDPLGRTLHEGDARVAATALLKDEALATGDLRFFKRLRDLGLRADFVGSGRAAAAAAAYVPQPVGIPP